MIELEEIKKRAKYESNSKKMELRKILPRRSVSSLGRWKLHLWPV